MKISNYQKQFNQTKPKIGKKLQKTFKIDQCNPVFRDGKD